ncbi:MAG: DUF4129 domain-containing protein [Anaerolineae bacterium]
MRLIGYRCALAVTLLALCLLALLPVHAQSAVDEDEFWQMLQRTAARLDNADEYQHDAVLAELGTMWQRVESVRLNSGQLLTIDMHWLTDDDSTLTQLRGYVDALLDYHARGRRLEDFDSDAALSILNGVLQDPRFSYPTPTPGVSEPLDLPSVEVNPLLSPELSQIILLVVGVIAVFATFAYLARGLRVQPTALETTEQSEDPTTSTQAQEMAQVSEEARDYRAAIRYLYLACLLLLDERGVLRYDPTLTNRELLRQVSDTGQHDLLRGVVHTFDRVWYGFAPVDAALYGEFRRSVEQLRTVSR